MRKLRGCDFFYVVTLKGYRRRVFMAFQTGSDYTFIGDIQAKREVIEYVAKRGFAYVEFGGGFRAPIWIGPARPSLEGYGKGLSEAPVHGLHPFSNKIPVSPVPLDWANATENSKNTDRKGSKKSAAKHC
jgi:hypothetical protein